jgi:YfiH family protein
VFASRDRRGPVEVAFTDRHGGASDGPFASLNLGGSGGDDPARVEQNIRTVSRTFVRGVEAGELSGPAPDDLPEFRLVLMHQVNGADVSVVDAGSAQTPVCDAVVTCEPGVVLMVRAADCAPVLLADAERAVVAAAHVGRPGMVAGIVAATLEVMCGAGARVITAWIGPHVCGRCYEVPAAMRDEVARCVPESRAETAWGTPAVDIGAGVRAQLEAEGVEIVDAARCTLEGEDLYSYRRQGGESGRLAGMVWIRP